MLPPNIRFSDNTRVFLKLRKALYGLRSASLAWYKHLSELVKEMGLHASDTEKSVFSGEYEFKGKKVWMLLLAYVDDLMIACKDKEAALNLVERLGRSVKIKVTGILSRDKKIDFLGRVIQKIEYGLLLGLPEGYFSSVYESYGIKKGTTTPPDLRKILDDALEKPECQKPLTAEAASRYRSAVGKISWGGQTRIDLTYFISVLSRGQSTPLVVHETCLRAFLRYLMSVDHLKQLMGAEECSGRVEAFVDSNWAPERNNDRRSLSGCVILVDGFPIKAFTRQQSSVAMSSAEAELVAITEGAKEAVGVVSLIQHIWGAFRTCQEPPAIISDSQAAINIGSMHGLLRRVRHIDQHPSNSSTGTSWATPPQSKAATRQRRLQLETPTSTSSSKAFVECPRAFASGLRVPASPGECTATNNHQCKEWRTTQAHARLSQPCSQQNFESTQ